MLQNLKYAFFLLVVFPMGPRAQIINTVAGSGILTWSGDGGPATGAGFDPID